MADRRVDLYHVRILLLLNHAQCADHSHLLRFSLLLLLLLHAVLVLLKLGSYGSDVSLATILLLEHMHLVVLSDDD